MKRKFLLPIALLFYAIVAMADTTVYVSDFQGKRTELTLAGTSRKLPTLTGTFATDHLVCLADTSGTLKDCGAKYVPPTIVTYTVNSTIASTTRFARCNKTTPMTVTAPSAGMDIGALLNVKNVGVGTCTVDSGNGHTIDGAQTFDLGRTSSISLLCTAAAAGVCSAWDIY